MEQILDSQEKLQNKTHRFFIEKWKFILFGVIYIISCTSFVFYLYGQAKKSIDVDINHRLYSGALLTVAALGEHYHDHLVDKHSKTEAQDWQTIQKLTAFSHQLNLTYLYTVIERNGQPILISSSASKDELEHNTYVRFFDPYPDASGELLTALHQHRVIWSNYTDHWGEFRAVFVPMQSKDGTPYIAGAEVSMANYRHHLNEQIFHFAGFSIFLFVDFSIFIAATLYFTSIRHRIVQLRYRTITLKKAQECADSANQAKSHFVAVMSHELRTPLNGVIGATELLSKTSLSNTQQNYLNIIQSSGLSLLTMVNEVLDLSKIESKKEKLEPHDFALEPFIQSILNLIRPQLNSPSILLDYDIDFRVSEFIKADSNKLRRILINILGNAAKFTDNGQINLTVHQVITYTNNLELKFEIQDSGIGISEEDQNQLFHPFSQIHNHNEQYRMGSGLGLSISKELVQMMGGNIILQSQSGHGTTFSFNIICQAAKKQNQSEIKNINIDNIKHHHPLLILVVDDSAVNLTLAKMMLEHYHHEVHTLNNGELIFKKINNTHYDIIFMDIHIGKVNGMDLVQKIRQIPNIEQPYIIAYTANAYAEDINQYHQCGMNDVLIKPVQLKNIKEILDRAKKHTKIKS